MQQKSLVDRLRENAAIDEWENGNYLAAQLQREAAKEIEFLIEKNKTPGGSSWISQYLARLSRWL